MNKRLVLAGITAGVLLGSAGCGSDHKGTTEGPEGPGVTQQATVKLPGDCQAALNDLRALGEPITSQLDVAAQELAGGADPYTTSGKIIALRGKITDALAHCQ
jgi:hypothetical protein